MIPGLAESTRRAALAAGAILLLALSAPDAEAADDVSEMTNTCAVSGGTATSGGGHFKCCWPDWGCVHCAVDNGAIYADQCWTDCDSQACRDANAADRLGLPQTKKPPAATTPGVTPGTVTPPAGKKPKAGEPGAGTVQ